MTLAFLDWWHSHAPKGTSNSINALRLIKRLQAAAGPLTIGHLADELGMSYFSIRTIIDFLREADLILTEARQHTTGQRSHYHVYALAPALRERLNQTSPP